MSCPPEVMAKLSDLRESLMHGAQVQDWLARWWGYLLPSDRQIFLALAGIDDSLQNARRHWAQFLPEDKKSILRECKKINRLTEAVAWA